jgi:fructose-1,6-bisphosphatase I
MIKFVTFFACVFCWQIPIEFGLRFIQRKAKSSLLTVYSSNGGGFPTDRKTFKRFMQIELWRTPELESLYPILCSLELACRDINRLMRRVSSDNLDGSHKNTNSTVSVNIQGEDQKKLDIIANRVMKISLCCSGKISIVASEEDDLPCLCSNVTDNAAFSGEYAAVFDPLDGSSNVDSGLPTGTIFGIYRNPKFRNVIDPLSTVKQKGCELVVAGYCLYAAATHIVITLRTGVHMFTLDDISGEFFLTRSNIRIPRTGPIYSFNDANSETWQPFVKYFISDLKNRVLPNVIVDKKPSARYMGALVADLHNIILNGGIFGYPGSNLKPNGKLRLLYEANPLSVIVEEAGGMASSGNKRILDLTVADIHQRTPLFIGSIEQVTALEKYFNFYSQ